MTAPARPATGVGPRRVSCILNFAFCIACVALTAACGARRVQLPSDPGSPLPNYAEIHAEVTASCRGARTLTAELGLRGRAGGRRLSGRLRAGFERPASMRLEAVAPFGPPGFILATRGDQAVLLLPRDERVVRGSQQTPFLERSPVSRWRPPTCRPSSRAASFRAKPVGGRHARQRVGLDRSRGRRDDVPAAHGSVAGARGAARRVGGRLPAVAGAVSAGHSTSLCERPWRTWT